MNSTNHKIYEFLKYYCQLTASPEYAVLIKGKWGTGKTWFIKNFISDLIKLNIKSLHISLYGMTSFDDIENEFFRQLHPVLSSKKMALAGKVLKGLLKTTLKIDLGKEDVTIASAIPDIELPEYLKDTENFVLIFDDIERCGIPISNLLGYINHFVEHSGHKVILVANEEEILEKEKLLDESKLSYERIKEKLIGKTFEIVPEVEAAISEFFLQSYSAKNREVLNAHKALIINLYNASEYKNLRHLKQAIADFERLLDAISEEAKSNTNLIKALIINYLIFAFEIKSGAMSPTEIKQFNYVDWTTYLMSKEKDPDAPFSKIKTKYPEFNIYDLILDENLWLEIFDKGIFDENAVFEQVNQSKYLFTEHTPSWKRLWYASELDDEEIKTLLDQVDQEFKNKQHKELEVFLHIFGLLLWLSDIGIYARNKDEILVEGKAYIDHLKRIKALIDQSILLDRPFFYESAHNLVISP